MNTGVMMARKQTGQGFMCNMTIKGPHGSSGGNTSIFRGLSHVPAFFRNVERYLTLKAPSRGISVPFVRGCVWWWSKRQNMRKNTALLEINVQNHTGFFGLSP